MRTALLALLLALLAAGTPVAGAAERRVALVIGNAGYREAPLANPRHDAYDIAAALAKLGFHVIVRTDADARAMRAALEEFGAELRRGSVGLFYYAGHGLSFDGANYLVPVDALIRGEADLAPALVNAAEALRTMEETRVKMSIMILDACRNNPFAPQVAVKDGARVLSLVRRDDAGGLRDGGLAHMSASAGSLIAFATAPGATAADGSGRNGTYTKHLLASLRAPDTEILKVFQRTRAAVVAETGGRQTPWESTSLVTDFHFGPNAAEVPAKPLEQGYANFQYPKSWPRNYYD